MERSLFIVFEGLDACGKSTISTEFAKQHQLTLKGALPDDLKSWLPRIAASGLPEATFSFFTLCNMMRAREVRKALDRGESIIMDRYFYTSYAYHKQLLENSLPDSIMGLYGSQDLPVPDLVIFLDVPQEVRRERITKRGCELQWYGDQVSMENDLTPIYFDLFKALDANVLRVDNHTNTVSESLQIINERYNQLVLAARQESNTVLSY